jgi:hypothetical protein
MFHFGHHLCCGIQFLIKLYVAFTKCFWCQNNQQGIMLAMVTRYELVSFSRVGHVKD